MWRHLSILAILLMVVVGLWCWPQPPQVEAFPLIFMPTPTVTPFAGCYIESSSVNHCGGALFDLNTATSVANTLSTTVPPSSSTVAFSFYSDVVGITDFSGNYTVAVWVDSLGLNITGYQFLLATGACGSTTPLAGSGVLSGTGLQIVTIPGVVGLGAATDKLLLNVLVFSNSGSDLGITVRVNSSDDRVDVPWCTSPTPTNTPTVTPTATDTPTSASCGVNTCTPTPTSTITPTPTVTPTPPVVGPNECCPCDGIYGTFCTGTGGWCSGGILPGFGCDPAVGCLPITPTPTVTPTNTPTVTPTPTATPYPTLGPGDCCFCGSTGCFVNTGICDGTLVHGASCTLDGVCQQPGCCSLNMSGPPPPPACTDPSDGCPVGYTFVPNAMCAPKP